MAQQSITRIISLLLLIALCALVAAIVGWYFFPGNLQTIIFVWLMLSVVVLTVPFLSWYLEPTRGTTPRKDVISIFVSIASSLILIGSLALAWLNLDSTRQQTEKTLKLSTAALNSAREEQKSRRFMDALESLDGEGANKRLAGVYAFRKLDQEFKNQAEWETQVLAKARKDELDDLEVTRKADLKEHWAIVEILTHTIQELAPLPEDRKKLSKPVVRVEVYEAMKYLGRRKLYAEEEKGMNLLNVDLRQYKFHEIRSAEKDCKDLCNGYCRPNFDRANFGDEPLNGANLSGANLECFSLRNAKFHFANLSGANLKYADLRGAEFTYAHLEGANLTGAILEGPNPLVSAYADEHTKCPEGFFLDAGTKACLRNP